jgi:hypothetical protein
VRDLFRDGRIPDFRAPPGEELDFRSSPSVSRSILKQQRAARATLTPQGNTYRGTRTSTVLVMTFPGHLGKDDDPLLFPRISTLTKAPKRLY